MGKFFDVCGLCLSFSLSVSHSLCMYVCVCVCDWKRGCLKTTTKFAHWWLLEWGRYDWLFRAIRILMGILDAYINRHHRITMLEMHASLLWEEYYGFANTSGKNIGLAEYTGCPPNVTVGGQQPTLPPRFPRPWCAALACCISCSFIHLYVPVM